MAIKRPTIQNGWLRLIAVLLVCLILSIGISTYLYLKNPVKENVVIKEVIRVLPSEPPKESDDIDVYPKKLPTYNNTSYQQIGILTSDETDKEPIVLPLFSRKVNHHKERWNYYTATDKNNMMRLPIKIENTNCEDDIGCREIYNNDKLTIEIYKGRTFTATIYKVDSPQYFADKY